MQLHRFSAMLLLGALFSIVVGCGGESLKFAPASGKVTSKGKPLANVLVRFLPDSLKGNKGPASSGTTDASGKFVLKSDSGVDGAVVGPHRAIFEDLDVDRPPQGQPQKNPPRFAMKWSIPSTGAEVDVTESGTPIEIDLNK